MKKWFAVKTFFLSSVAVNKKKSEKSYSKTSVFLEERIVLFHSNNMASAMKAGEKEAESYAKYEHINPYGEKVTCKYMNICEAFEMFDPPSHKKEVFSTTAVYLNRKIAKRTALDQLGPIYSEKKERLLRRKFRHW